MLVKKESVPTCSVIIVIIIIFLLCTRKNETKQKTEKQNTEDNLIYPK